MTYIGTVADLLFCLKDTCLTCYAESFKIGTVSPVKRSRSAFPRDERPNDHPAMFCVGMAFRPGNVHTIAKLIDFIFLFCATRCHQIMMKLLSQSFDFQTKIVQIIIHRIKRKATEATDMLYNVHSQ